MAASKSENIGRSKAIRTIQESTTDNNNQETYEEVFRVLLGTSFLWVSPFYFLSHAQFSNNRVLLVLVADIFFRYSIEMDCDKQSFAMKGKDEGFNGSFVKRFPEYYCILFTDSGIEQYLRVNPQVDCNGIGFIIILFSMLVKIVRTICLEFQGLFIR